MTEIYVVRHCEAMGNAKRIFQGVTDCDISELGEKQLVYLSKRFENVKIDRVYSSPLIRAVKTAHAIADPKGLSVEPEAGLIEINGGIVEGKPFVEAFNAIEGLAETWDCHPQDFAPEGGEPMRHAYERIWNTVLGIARENEGKSVALAAHGGVIRCLNCRLTKGGIEHLKDMEWSENTAVTLLSFDDKLNPSVVYMNDISHVPGELIPKRNRLSNFMSGVRT